LDLSLELAQRAFGGSGFFGERANLCKGLIPVAESDRFACLDPLRVAGEVGLRLVDIDCGHVAYNMTMFIVLSIRVNLKIWSVDLCGEVRHLFELSETYGTVSASGMLNCFSIVSQKALF